MPKSQTIRLFCPVRQVAASGTKFTVSDGIFFGKLIFTCHSKLLSERAVDE